MWIQSYKKWSLKKHIELVHEKIECVCNLCEYASLVIVLISLQIIKCAGIPEQRWQISIWTVSSEFGRHFSGHLWHTLWSHSRCELIYNFRYLCKSQSMQEHLRCGILIWTVSSEFWYLCKLYSAQEHTHIVSVNEKVRYPCSQCEYWATINLNQFHEKLKYPYYHCDKHHTQRVMWRDILNQSRGKISTHVINVYIKLKLKISK